MKIAIFSISFIAFSFSVFSQAKPYTKPQFPGGEGTWTQYLESKTNCTFDSAIDFQKGLSTTILLSFIIEKDGTISNVEVLNKQKTNPILAAEAIQIIKQSPKWIPATKNGKPQRFRIKQTIIWDFSEE